MVLSNSNLKTSLLVVFGFLVMLVLPLDKLFEPFSLTEFQQDRLGDAWKNIFIMIYGYLLIKTYGYTKIFRLLNFRHRHAFLVIISLYFLLLGPIEYALRDFNFTNIQTVNVLILLFSMITVGFSEELIFRGFVLPKLNEEAPSKQSLVVPLVYSSLLFGVLHFLNLLRPDSYFPLVFSQVLYAAFFGMAFGVILLRTGSILPLGFIHGLINFPFNWDDLLGTVATLKTNLFMYYEAILSVPVVLPFLTFILIQVKKIDRLTLLKKYYHNTLST